MICVAPDVGGTERARALGKILNVGLAIVDKRRPKPGQAQVMNIIGDVKGKTCIIVDDIIDSGGTIVNAAKALKDRGAKEVYVYITHGVFSGEAVKKIKNSVIKNLVITDTIDNSERTKNVKNIEVLNNYLDYLLTWVKTLWFMNSLEANIRDNKSKGQLNILRKNGNVPAIIYGGKEQNQKISISKKLLKTLIEKENFLSNMISLNIEGKTQNVLPREVKYHIISDEPTHVDFLRVLPGVKIKIEVPVNFINQEDSPGLKRGGVLNIVRRKVELKCPSEKIPESITIDLSGVDIGESFKISSVKLDPEVVPTIQGRDFVIATLAAPTVMKEPEKPAEADAAEGESGAEGTEAAAADGDKPAVDGDKKEVDEKKPSEKKPAEEKK